MYSHFGPNLGFYSTEDQIHNGATPHVADSTLSIPFLLMPWRLKEPGHQQVWYWPYKPEYSVSSIRRVNLCDMFPKINSAWWRLNHTRYTHIAKHCQGNTYDTSNRPNDTSPLFWLHTTWESCLANGNMHTMENVPPGSSHLHALKPSIGSWCQFCHHWWHCRLLLSPRLPTHICVARPRWVKGELWVIYFGPTCHDIAHSFTLTTV